MKPRIVTTEARGHRRPHVQAQPIRPGELLPLDAIHTHLGYGSRVRREMLAAGLPVFRFARRGWVRSDDLIAFLTTHGERSGLERLVEVGGE